MIDSYKVKNTGLYHDAGLPNITGYMEGELNIFHMTGYSGAFYPSNHYTYEANAVSQSSQWNYYRAINFNASRSSSIYGKSDTVQPKSIELSFYIKF